MRIRYKSTTGNEGFTLVEVMISVVILLVGLLTILALFAKGLSATQFAQQDMIAKQKAREQLEAIYSARNDGRIAWASITNTPLPAPQIYFPSGFQTLYKITDNSTDLVGSNKNSGVPDFIVTRASNGDFLQVNLNNYQRQVDIQKVGTNDDLKQITVTVRVNTPGIGSRDYVVIGYVSQSQ